MPALEELSQLLNRYSGVGNGFAERLNLVRARLIEDGSWAGMTPKIALNVYTDADGYSIVTLPRQYIAILRGKVVPVPARPYAGQQLGTSGVFNDTGMMKRDFQEVPDYFCVFSEWTTPMRIRLKFEVAETPNTIYLSGKSNGADVWATNTGLWENREAVSISGDAAPAAVTSTNTFDAKGFKLSKPVTLGRVSIYTVSDADVETLVGVCEPTETTPRRRRYRVPCASGANYTYEAIVRVRYVPVSISDEEVIPGNIAALRYGLSALLKEDAEDYERAEQLWQLARERLMRQSESESEGTEDRIEIEDDMNMASVGRGL